MVVAYAQADEGERAFWHRTLETGDIRDGDLDEAIAHLRRHGAIEATIARARRFAEEAHQALAIYPERDAARPRRSGRFRGRARPLIRTCRLPPRAPVTFAREAHQREAHAEIPVRPAGIGAARVDIPIAAAYAHGQRVRDVVVEHGMDLGPPAMAAVEHVRFRAELVLAQEVAVVAIALRIGHERRVDRQAELRRQREARLDAEARHVPGRHIGADLLARREQGRPGTHPDDGTAEIVRKLGQPPIPTLSCQ